MSPPGNSKRSVAPAPKASSPTVMSKSKSKPKPNLPFTAEEFEELSKTKVLIAGGGLGGLTLALLLHKAKIPFLVFERAREVKPLGSAILLGVCVGPLFKQLGIWEEFITIAKPQMGVQLYNEELKPLFFMSSEYVESLTNYRQYVISRPEIYDLLLRHIPPENILFGKRILSFKQSDECVEIQCSDNSAFHGDILVGADGAYSAVRQNLYKQLKVKHKLPAKDDVSLPYSCVCLVGQTTVLDPEEFPALKSNISDFNSVLGSENMCTFLTKETFKMNDSFRNSEWGPEAAEALCREVRDFKVPGLRNGKPMTLGDYIDRSPKEYIAKVMLEEIVFDTWYGGRAVLLGDGQCDILDLLHTMNPSGAAGAITAMHDAVTLANWISTLRLPTVPELEEVFEEYRAERYPVAQKAFESSQVFTKALGKSALSVLVRATMKRIPIWLWKKVGAGVINARHQASFLPEVEDKARLKRLYQPSLHKTREILVEQLKNKAIDTVDISPVVAV
ncbi:hypothetical protein BG003_007303 [Podila horticola]|nr:hypothetical protein BG003_007303 [Podila horticola]